MALEAHDAKKKTAANKGKLDLFPKPPMSKFVKAAKFGTALGGLAKNLPSAAPQSQQRSGSIAAALKKTANVAMEISVPTTMKKTEGTGTETGDVTR
jgi:hypothetical protein